MITICKSNKQKNDQYYQFLGCSWALLGRYWGALGALLSGTLGVLTVNLEGRSWGWALLVHSVGARGCSWVALGRSWKAFDTPKYLPKPTSTRANNLQK